MDSGDCRSRQQRADLLHSNLASIRCSARSNRHAEEVGDGAAACGTRNRSGRPARNRRAAHMVWPSISSLASHAVTSGTWHWQGSASPAAAEAVRVFATRGAWAHCLHSPAGRVVRPGGKTNGPIGAKQKLGYPSNRVRNKVTGGPST
ncbi:hypothetical protein [Oryza sativa Japonica Group]|uniref:Uncharacterized protein P0025A05.5 n=1 Tax=Oryza sativa subsp. japonica TaxID=39947 RepID=Q5ZAG8_ORYSJ|nr:hypothetical protein [Oryza sativa Japonica Group]